MQREEGRRKIIRPNPRESYEYGSIGASIESGIDNSYSELAAESSEDFSESEISDSFLEENEEARNDFDGLTDIEMNASVIQIQERNKAVRKRRKGRPRRVDDSQAISTQLY